MVILGVKSKTGLHRPALVAYFSVLRSRDYMMETPSVLVAIWGDSHQGDEVPDG